MVEFSPVKWHKPYSLGNDVVNDRLAFLNPESTEPFHVHFRRHMQFNTPFYFDCETLFMRYPDFANGIKPHLLEISKIMDELSSYSPEIIGKGSLYLAALMDFDFDGIEYVNFTRNLEIDLANKVKNNNLPTSSDFSPAFLPFVPEEGFPEFSQKSLTEARNYFRRARYNYNQILMNGWIDRNNSEYLLIHDRELRSLQRDVGEHTYMRRDLTGRPYLQPHELEDCLEVKANKRAVVIDMLAGSITNSDLEVQSELDAWREAAYKHHRTVA